MNYFALVTRGLEEVACRDIQQQFPDIRITASGYRRILFTYEGNPADLLKLRSVDDVFYFLDSFLVSRRREALQTIEEKIGQCNFLPFIDSLKKVRSLHTPYSFSVSVSNVGEKNYTPSEIKNTITTLLHETRQWEEKEDGSQGLHVRIFIEKEEALVGLRVGDAPLHRRDYKKTTLPGSLRPSIAYGMLLMANIAPHAVVLDPLCGVGTIALEATYLTDTVLAGDLNPEAIQIAQASSVQIHSAISFTVWDAKKLPIADATVDAVVTNVPFGKQIPIDNMEAFFSSILAEWSRVLKSDGTIVLLTTHTDLLERCVEKCGLHITAMTEISLFGLTPSIITIKKK